MTNITDQELELLREIADLLNPEPVVRVGGVTIENIGGAGGHIDGMPGAVHVPRVTSQKLAELMEKAEVIRKQAGAAGTVMNLLMKVITAIPRFSV